MLCSAGDLEAVNSNLKERLEKNIEKDRPLCLNKHKVNNFTLFVPCDVGMNCHKDADNIDSNL